MSLLHLPCSQLPLPLFRPICFYSSRPKPKPQNLPARDRVIDFGKHKGRMLGSLPSNYLLWVSKNLRARNFEHWARLADEVLRDPVYRDRIEWESAERILNGDGRRGSSESPVSDLLDISERFGWDNEDKASWARVDFQLLGTSMGGRIPRVNEGGQVKPEGDRRSKQESKGGIFSRDLKEKAREQKKYGIFSSDPKASRSGKMGSLEKEMGSSGRDWRCMEVRKDGIFGEDFKVKSVGIGSEEEMGTGMRDGSIGNARKVGFLSKGHRFVLGEEESEGDEELKVRRRRAERMERRRMKREQQVRNLRREVGVEEGSGGREGVFVKKIEAVGSAVSANPFPGRGVFLDKINEQRD
ncbi:uncharacterized protein LOC103703998 isoform X2 [Phoenix dactylifera]|uniref:Uncharacterized protein LOC103703998 isoform X2 n=1 Tax=Phoenix dactylifera TaxID=42345 RepID=A0A8B8J2N3_PHODC|nr:uncharacterized protein LOC103703998 isoform X2 [Phoenix dactylifera]